MGEEEREATQSSPTAHLEEGMRLKSLTPLLAQLRKITTLIPTYKYLVILKKIIIYFQGPPDSAPAQKGLTFSIRYQGSWDGGGKKREIENREVWKNREGRDHVSLGPSRTSRTKKR